MPERHKRRPKRQEQRQRLSEKRLRRMKSEPQVLQAKRDKSNPASCQSRQGGKTTAAMFKKESKRSKQQDKIASFSDHMAVFA